MSAITNHAKPVVKPASALGTAAAKATRKSRYTFDSDPGRKVETEERGSYVGLGADNNSAIPYLIHDSKSGVEALQVGALRTAFEEEAMPIIDVIGIYAGVGKLDLVLEAMLAHGYELPAAEPAKK